MSVAIAAAEDSMWPALSESILREAELTSLDNLLEQALTQWLERLSPEQRWKVAIDLYTAEHVSSGKAAEIAGLNYFVFEKKLKLEGIPFLEAEATTVEEVNYQEELIDAFFDLPKT